MAYTKPTEDGIRFAMDNGWTKEEAERGYAIFNFDGLDLFQIEAICDCYPNGDYDDDAAATEAEHSGYCKIIPVDELPDPFIISGYSCRYFGWVDTPENRKAIWDYCNRKRSSLTLEKTTKVLKDFIRCELETYSVGIVSSEFANKRTFSREELDEIGGYGWLYDIDRWDERMIDELSYEEKIQKGIEWNS